MDDSVTCRRPEHFATGTLRRGILGRVKNLLPLRSELSQPFRYVSDHRFGERLRVEGYTG